MEAYEYFIHDQNAHFWEEAVEHCKRNGTILAVLDTQAKLDELSRRLTSQGYKNWHRFWIGLVFNASIRQFVWSSGATVNVTSINNTCDNSFYSQNRCFLLRRFKSNCFQGKACDQRLLIAAGFICQPTVQKATTLVPTPSSLATHLSTRASEIFVATTTDKAVSRASNSGQHMATSVISSSSTNTETHIPIASKPPRREGTTTYKVETIMATSTSTFSSNSAASHKEKNSESSLNTENPRNSVNPLVEFSNLMNSLDPKDPLSLKVATEAFKKLATSVQSMSKLRGDINVIQSTQTIEEFAFKYASFNLNTSHPEERKENKHIVLQVSLLPRGYSGNFTFTEQEDFEDVARITLPPSLFQEQDIVVVNALYRDLHKITSNPESRNSKLDSMILGSDFRPTKQDIFAENVTITLRTLEENDSKRKKKCVFWKWNFSYPANGSWSGDGCSLVESNESHVVCTCNHLTNFAILMNVNQHKFSDKHKQALCYVTYVGLGISLLGETITIIAYLLLICSNPDQQSHLHINLVATLAMAQIIFLTGINATHNQVLCITVAALIHYFYLSSFCWMLIEGIMLYLLIIEVYNTELKLPLCYGFSLGFPGLVVGGTLIIAHLRREGIHQYTANSWCWLSTERYYIWSFAGPVILISVVNVVVFCIVVKEMVSMTSMQSSKLNRVKAAIKACIVLFPLLGITWLFGLLSMARASVVSQYVFTVLNSIQGLLIFVFHCVRNTEIRVVWDKKLKKMKKQAWLFFKLGGTPQTSTSENNSNKQGPSELELNRRANKITPVE